MSRMIAPFKIRLGTVLLKSPGILQEFVERLYLGKPCRYVLSFPLRDLTAVERAFDQIIFKHGILEVEFVYDFDKEELPVEGVMKILDVEDEAA